jgi:hypothetical protein
MDRKFWNYKSVAVADENQYSVLVFVILFLCVISKLKL